MKTRRIAREKAVQFLFQYDLNKSDRLEEALSRFWESQQVGSLEQEKGATTWGQPLEPAPPTTDDLAIQEFANPLIHGVLEHWDEINDKITAYAQNWELRRIAVVDRNVLRLAIFEMLHRFDIPPIVSINEAVDIAKKYSTHDSGKFVNGILDRIKNDLLRPARIVS